MLDWRLLTMFTELRISVLKMQSGFLLRRIVIELHEKHMPILKILLADPRRMRVDVSAAFNRRLRNRDVHISASMRTLDRERREPRRRVITERSNPRRIAFNNRGVLQFRPVHPPVGHLFEITHRKTKSIHRTYPRHAIHRSTIWAGDLHNQPVSLVCAATPHSLELESRNQNLQSLCDDPSLRDKLLKLFVQSVYHKQSLEFPLQRPSYPHLRDEWHPIHMHRYQS